MVKKIVKIVNSVNVPELSATELRRMVKAHNQFVDIKIPPKTTRDGLITLINKNGFKVDHEKKQLVPMNSKGETVKGKTRRLPTVNNPPAPKKKTDEEKKMAKDMRSKKEMDRDQVGYDRVLSRMGKKK
tara:strand:- start:254 stop:640 length:387 start_codon:yes stop_codon:yes gene_type:complete